MHQGIQEKMTERCLSSCLSENVSELHNWTHLILTSVTILLNSSFQLASGETRTCLRLTAFSTPSTASEIMYWFGRGIVRFTFTPGQKGQQRPREDWVTRLSYRLSLSKPKTVTKGRLCLTTLSLATSALPSQEWTVPVRISPLLILTRVKISQECRSREVPSTTKLPSYRSRQAFRSRCPQA